MISKKNKLLTTEVRRVFRCPDKVFFSNFFKILFVFNSEKPKFAVIVPSFITKKAVDRKKIRRKIYSILFNLYKKQPAGFYIIIIRGNVIKASVKELKKDLESLLNKIK